MKSDLKTRHGGKILADALAAQGVKLAFGVPGESYLPVLDGLHDLQDRLRFIVCRQEGGASYMAEAYGKLTGEPGVLFVTRGPGATNGAVGVHTGFQDSTPMVVFIGQVRQRVRRARGVPGDRLPAHVRPDGEVGGADRPRRAHSGVRQPRLPHRDGGPARARWCSRCPRTRCSREAAVADAPQAPHGAPGAFACGDAGAEEAARKARKPLRHPRRRRLGPRRHAASCRSGSKAQGLPVGTSFRCQDLFDNRSPSYAGDVGIGINPKLAQRVKEADVLLVIGARLGEMTTSAYTLVEAPVPQADADPRARRRRGARPRLPAGAGDQLRLSAVRRCACEHLSFENPAGRNRPQRPARNIWSGPSRGRCRARCSTAR